MNVEYGVILTPELFLLVVDLIFILIFFSPQFVPLCLHRLSISKMNACTNTKMSASQPSTLNWPHTQNYSKTVKHSNLRWTRFVKQLMRVITSSVCVWMLMRLLLVVFLEMEWFGMRMSGALLLIIVIWLVLGVSYTCRQCWVFHFSSLLLPPLSPIFDYLHLPPFILQTVMSVSPSYLSNAARWSKTQSPTKTWMASTSSATPSSLLVVPATQLTLVGCAFTLMQMVLLFISPRMSRYFQGVSV